MMGRKKFDMKNFHTLSLDDLVPPNSLYRKVDEVIDFAFIYDLAKGVYSYTGQPSLDPVVFFKIELVGFLEGIHEDRALERRLKDSLAIRWFLGYDLDESLPVHSTISRTRKERISKELYEAVFEHILSLCIRHQLVKGHHQSIDSTLLRANASLHSLEALKPKVTAHYEKALANNAGESDRQDPPSDSPPFHTGRPMRRDPEAKITQKPGFPFAPYYKASASVDQAYGILTHAQVDDANQNDFDLLHPIITCTHQRLDKFRLKLSTVGLDQGYYSAENLNFLDQRQITPYVQPKYQPNNTGGLDKSQFRYDAANDQFLCPEGEALKFQFYGKQPHIKKYRSSEKDCLPCPQKTHCTSAKVRTVSRSIYAPLIEAAFQRARSFEGRQADRLRRTQAEGSFAHLKETLKFKKLYSLGLENARKKFLMACSVINLKKLLQALGDLRDVFLIFLRLWTSFSKNSQLCSLALSHP